RNSVYYAGNENVVEPLAAAQGHNIISLNNFIDNEDNTRLHEATATWHSPEPITYIFNNQTFTRHLGNHWCDYQGSDADGDGIGDTPHIINGDKDYHPLMERFENYLPLPNQTPIASFTYFPEAPDIGEEITFNASASSDPDGKIISYQWDFGDENKASGKIVSHVYPSAGNYTVTLTVTDDAGATDSISKTLAVGGVIQGYIYLQGRTDHSGATVSINGHSTTTNSDGSFFLDVPAGTYTIIASMSAYLPAAKPDVGLEAGATHVLGTVTLLGGDATRDGVINAADLAQIAANFNTPDPDSDINADAWVDISDLVLAGLNFGKSSSPWD
ncbi:PKD domain-containing protein, partial [Dehalococcoidia bacterium]|nr:PKD domain-containing protein [Dehalococcoidia bacterium]